jgi:hypothetical protein
MPNRPKKVIYLAFRLPRECQKRERKQGAPISREFRENKAWHEKYDGKGSPNLDRLFGRAFSEGLFKIREEMKGPNILPVQFEK